MREYYRKFTIGDFALAGYGTFVAPQFRLYTETWEQVIGLPDSTEKNKSKRHNLSFASEAQLTIIKLLRRVL